MGVVAGLLGIVALAAIAASVVCALAALYVRHRGGPLGTWDRPPSESQLWFYALIAQVDPKAFIEVAAAVTEADEVQIRLHQIAVMAPIMRRRANWVNAAYVAAGTGIVAFILTIAAYLLCLADH